MTEQEMINQLGELINDRKSLISDDEETNKIYEKDIKAIRQIIKGYKEMQIELSGYRQSLLKSIGSSSFALQHKIDKTLEVINTQMKLAEDGIKENLRIIKFYLIKGECSVYDLTTEEDYKY